MYGNFSEWNVYREFIVRTPFTLGSRLAPFAFRVRSSFSVHISFTNLRSAFRHRSFRVRSSCVLRSLIVRSPLKWESKTFQGLHMIVYFFQENVALNKPAYQQYQYLNVNASITDASNAVDGLKSDLSRWGGQCVFSDEYKKTATWWVNLTSIHSIHHVTIYYMQGSDLWGMQLIINSV